MDGVAAVVSGEELALCKLNEDLNFNFTQLPGDAAQALTDAERMCLEQHAAVDANTHADDIDSLHASIASRFENLKEYILHQEQLKKSAIERAINFQDVFLERLQ